MLRLIPLALLLVRPRARRLRLGRRERRLDDRRDRDPGGRAGQGRPRRRPGPARRQRLQRARVSRRPARREGARSQGARGRVCDRGRLHPEHDLAGAQRLRPRDRRRLRAGRRDRQGGAEVSRHEVRDHRRRPGVRARQAGQRAGPALPRAGGRLPRRLPGRARGEAPRRQGRDQRRRRDEGAAGRPLHRRLLRGRREGRPRDQADPRLLAGLGRPGEVQGAGAEPDRARLERDLPGRGRLRPRRAQRGRRAQALGDRRRRRPVVPRLAHPHERPEGRRRRRLPDDQGDSGRQLEGRRQRHLRAQGGGRRARQGQPRRAAGGRGQGRRDQAADRRRRDHRDPDRGRSAK